MNKKTIHIVSFDIPYPANYGGIIDVFHRIRKLKDNNVDVILHCFQYGREESKELESYCQKVYYYPRKMNPIEQLSNEPFIVKSRRSDLLLKHLLQDNHPILFEGIHSCHYMANKKLSNRKKIVRMHNIEQDYYSELAKQESSFIKKLFFRIEAMRLKHYENILNNADLILCVAEDDLSYFRSLYADDKVIYLPSFNAFDEVNVLQGKGDYAFYHGNLSVAENHNAAMTLVNDIFSKIEYPFYVAGMNPREELKKSILKYSHIHLVENPEENKMNELLQHAQINILITQQATGLKLKLLNTLFIGRHCVVNLAMLSGTKLDTLCYIADTSDEIIKKIKELENKEIDRDIIEERKKQLEFYCNQSLAQQLISRVWNVD